MTMSDITTHLLLPYILAAQAQKHVTHNEALRLLDAIVQLSVLDRDLTVPHASPADGDRYRSLGGDRSLGGLGSECDHLGRRRLDAPGAAPRLAGLDR